MNVGRWGQVGKKHKGDEKERELGKEENIKNQRILRGAT